MYFFPFNLCIMFKNLLCLDIELMNKSAPLHAVLILILALVAILSLPVEVDAYTPSCENGEITIRWCRMNNDVMRVRFYANTVSDPKDLQYILTTSLDEEFWWGAITKGPIQDIALEWAGKTEYLFELDVDQPMSTIHISDPQCIGEHYLSDRATCELTTTVDFLDADSPCGDYPTLDGRVRCRLYRVGIPTNDVPEECRILSGAERSKCITEYDELMPCLHERDDASILACAERTIGLDTTVLNAKKECEARPEMEQASCLSSLGNQVNRMAKFKFRLLKQKVTSLMWEGVSEEHIITFISNLEVRTQAYNSVKTSIERINIVNQVQDLWDGFTFTAEPQVLSYFEDQGCDSCD